MSDQTAYRYSLTLRYSATGKKAPSQLLMTTLHKVQVPADGTKVLLGFSEVAGFYSGLSLGLQEIGAVPECCFLENHKFDFPVVAECNLSLWRLIRLVHRSRMNSSPRTRRVLTAIEGLLRVFFFVVACFRYQYFIFGQGNTLLPRGLDLLILRTLRKHTVMVSHGSDFRPWTINGFSLEGYGDVDEKARLIVGHEKLRMRAIRRIEKNVEYFVGHPPSSSQLLTRRQAKSLSLGLASPVPSDASNECITSTGAHDLSLNFGSGRPVRVLHSASLPGPSGTDSIIRMVQELQEEGLPIEFRVLTGVSNAEVLDQLAWADIALDKLYSDTPMAKFAAEAAAAGVPCVVGCYAKSLIEWTHSRDEIPPTLFCLPTEYKSQVRELILDSNLRRLCGQACQDFVRSMWSPRQVAGRYWSLMNGQAPESWFFNPDDVGYYLGVGLDSRTALSLIRKVVELGGIESLGFCSKQSLALASSEALDPELQSASVTYSQRNPRGVTLQRVKISLESL